jgi:hypothetical protein
MTTSIYSFQNIHPQLMYENDEMMIPEEVIISKIYQIRNRKVMLDMDLAELYCVETKRLNEQVKRNLDRFPADFMFQLSQDEFENLKSHFATSSWGGRRKLPFAFSEHGVLMLASVLNSERAIKVNILIVRVFIKMREMLLDHEEFMEKFKQIETKLTNHDNQILLISEYLSQLEQSRQQQEDQANRKKIGFRQDENS